MGFYSTLATERVDSKELQDTVELAINQLRDHVTSVNRPGILFGKIQSGKTRAFLGVIAAAFDDGFGAALVLTKGSISLTRQTLKRIEADFHTFAEDDKVQIFDILNVPPALSDYELKQKLIIVAKKEDDNLKRVIEMIDSEYPSLKERRWLIVDDEADFASITFRKSGAAVSLGTINQQIEDLRVKLENSQFLQVTATPYSLYLQPEEGLRINGIPISKPRKPAFTIILPQFTQYVGGSYYFDESLDDTSAASYLYEEVPQDECDALKKEDRRRFNIEDVLTAPKTDVLRHAIVNFVVGGCIRRMRQRQENTKQLKYSFVVHTEQGRGAHDWQLRVVSTLWDKLKQSARNSDKVFLGLVEKSYLDLALSLGASGDVIPSLAEVVEVVRVAIADGHLSISKVNSDSQIDSLLDESGQLRLRTPFNLFIGGQILDRGVTIQGLIGFYYGRNPKRSQQDTVLQHSRMYGARPSADLPVTRLYAPIAVYNRMKQIEDLDAALRDAFVSGAHDRGVYFVETASAGNIVPCAPNKLFTSEIYSIRPGRRLLPLQFNTVAISRGAHRLEQLDSMVHAYSMPPHDKPVLVSVEDGVRMIILAYENLVFDDEEEGAASQKALVAALEWLVKGLGDTKYPGKLWMIVAEDRAVKRLRNEGRFSNAPDTKQQKDLASSIADCTPVLTMMRQRGTEEDGWRGLPFWWPVVLVPKEAITSIYAVN